MSQGLRIAVPRGALFGDTLDLLDKLGLDTTEVRENDRKLLFEESGIVTMRPSDVPTYVEAGAADLGITGKDVLMEQSEREVYELVDLGYGFCRMVLASEAGEDRVAEALRRLSGKVAPIHPGDGLAGNHIDLAAGSQAGGHCRVVRDRMIAGIERGHGDLDWTALGLVAEEEAGLRATPPVSDK